MTCLRAASNLSQFAPDRRPQFWAVFSVPVAVIATARARLYSPVDNIGGMALCRMIGPSGEFSSFLEGRELDLNLILQRLASARLMVHNTKPSLEW